VFNCSVLTDTRYYNTNSMSRDVNFIIGIDQRDLVHTHSISSSYRTSTSMPVSF
jgi:hypothetical protein